MNLEAEAEYYKIIEALSNAPTHLESLMKLVDKDTMYLKYNHNWSIHQHCLHLCYSDEEVYIPRLLQFELDEVFIQPQAGLEGGYLLAINGLLDNFAAQRQRMLGMCDIKLLLKSAKHPEYKQYNYQIMLRHIMLHDHFHMYRIEDLALRL